ncbi:response regulator transcription factor [Streptomyces sp. NPDC055189]
MTRVVRALIASDQLWLSDAVAGLLETQGSAAVVGWSADDGEVESLAGELQPDVVLIAMRTGTAGPLIRRVRVRSPSARVVALQLGRRPDARLQLMRAGAHFFIPWSARLGDVLDVLHGAVPDTSAQVSSPILTEREQQVLNFVARSWTNRQIAKELQLKEGTVKRHLHSVFQKLGATSRLDAVTKAVRAGLLSGLQVPDVAS